MAEEKKEPQHDTNMMIKSHIISSTPVYFQGQVMKKSLPVTLQGLLIKHVSSHKYIHPNGGKAKPKPGTSLVIHSHTDNWRNRLLFAYTPEGYIQHISSGLYICIKESNPSLLTLDVKDENAKWDIQPGGCIKHRFKELWWHPKGGKAHPHNNTKLCLDGNRDRWEKRLKWTFTAFPVIFNKRIEDAYSKKKKAGSEKSSVSIRAMNGFIAAIPTVLPQTAAIWAVIGYWLDETEVQNISAWVKKANLEQTTMEKMSDVIAAERVMENQKTEDNFHTVLEDHLVDLEQAEMALYYVADADNNTTILSVQCWIYAAGVVLAVFLELRKTTETMNKYAEGFVKKGSHLQEKLNTQIKGKRQKKTIKIPDTDTSFSGLVRHTTITCTLSDKAHGIKLVWEELHKEPPSIESLKQMARSYVLEKSGIQEAIQSWTLIAKMK